MIVAEAEFSLTYAGPSVDDGTMPVRDLAPALFALGEVFAAASRTLYPDREVATLSIKADPERGSFLVHLLLGAGSWEAFLDLFGSSAANALANLEAIVIGTNGLFNWIRKRNNRPIVIAEPAQEPGVMKVTFADGASLEVPASVLDLEERVEVRRATRAVVGPLTREGVEVIRFGRADADKPLVEIAQEEVEAFELPAAEDEEIDDETRDVWLEIAAARFAEHEELWRFFDGAAYFGAEIRDDVFLGKVARKEIPVYSRDSIYCRLRTITTRKNGRLSKQHIVLEVLEHRSGEMQTELF